jgi:hypothetical protein
MVDEGWVKRGVKRESLIVLEENNLIASAKDQS